MHLERSPGSSRLAAAAVALAAVLAQPPCAPGQEPPAKDAAAAGSALGVDLYRQFAAEDGNVFFSPYSVAEGLALLASGAEGRTRQELLSVMHWSLGPDRMPAAFADQDLMLDGAAKGGDVLTVANSLWCQRDLAPRAAFIRTAQQAFRADVRVADFGADLPVSQRMINYWVERKTGGKITGLLTEGSLTPRTQLVLANAIYFKGRWERPFDSRRTAPAPFATARGLTVMAPTMAVTGRFRTKGLDAFELLELPYAGGSLSMAILLPRSRDGLRPIEQRLGAPELSQWLASLDAAGREELEITLPRFKMTYAADLAKALARLGVATAFQAGAADFSPINGRHEFFVSNVLHKAIVDVSEEGTEAAAATGVAMSAAIATPPRKFPVDHPFLFLIRDAQTGSLLFLGRVADPRTP